MTDHAEEQEMEAEAMAAIFDTNFEVVETTETKDRVWRITIYPEAGTTDVQELESLNHVGCRLVVTLPETYPEIVPEIRIEIVKGLASEHQDEIQLLAMDEATNNLGTPSIYAITERIREWLIENNAKGLDDISMHAQMIRKKLQEEKSKVSTCRTLVLLCCSSRFG
jgi:RWD domain